MKKILTLFITALITSTLFIVITSATTINQLVEINGTLYMNTTYDDGSSKLIQVVYVNGTAYLNITYDDGSNKLEELKNFIQEHESQWSTDTRGISVEELVYYLQGAVNWLKGKEGTPEEYKEIGATLDSYFANKRDIYVLQQQINDLRIRTIFLEKTMEDIAADAYCQGKLDTMIEYNLSWVKCGENSTIYYRVDPSQFGGYNVISAEPINPTIIPGSNATTNETYPNITIIGFHLSELKPGETATAIVVVHNFGNATGSVEVGVDIPPTWTMEPKSVNVTLKPGETRVVDFTITVPENEQGKFSITGYAGLVGGNHSTETLNVTIEPRITPLSGFTGYITSAGSGISSTLTDISTKIKSFFSTIFIPKVSAATMHQLVEINGTLYMNTTYDDGSSSLNQVVYVNGTAYLNITYDDGMSKLDKLQSYIEENKIKWSKDA